MASTIEIHVPRRFAIIRKGCGSLSGYGLDLAKVCDAYFGAPRQKSTSHRVYRTPWLGDPRVNIQNAKGMAKPYQVRQVIKAIEKLEGMR